MPLSLPSFIILLLLILFVVGGGGVGWWLTARTLTNSVSWVKTLLVGSKLCELCQQLWELDQKCSCN